MSITVDRDAGLVRTTTDRPQWRDALTPDGFVELSRVLDEVARTPTDGTVLLTGAGSAFCAGADISSGMPDGPVLRLMGRISDVARSLLLGETISATQARGLGPVAEVTAPVALLDRATAAARQLAGGPPTALAQTSACSTRPSPPASATRSTSRPWRRRPTSRPRTWRRRSGPSRRGGRRCSVGVGRSFHGW